MNSTQSHFLREPEIDQLDQIFAQGLFDTEEGQMMLEALFASWTDIQAISNLLLYPTVLPLDRVFPFLQKGLEDTNHLYLNLAAIVGIGKLPRSFFPASEQEYLKTKLFHACQHPHPSISARASLSLTEYCEQEDISVICHLLPHAVPTSNHNLLYILYRLVSPASYDEFLLLLQEKFIPPGKVKTPLNLIQKEIKHRQVDPGNDSVAPLLAFIPNFVQFNLP
jgi:hypothetical protein